ncbi:MAG: proton-conducting transporter membrane subunit [Alphaproteobacteria bacterium]
MSIISVSPLLAVFASLSGVAALGFIRDAAKIRNISVVICAVLQIVILATMIPAITGGKVLTFEVLSLIPEASIGFRVDGLGLTFALVASILWLVTAVYSFGYLDALSSPKQTRFQALFALTISCTLGVAFASNLLTLYFFFEAMTIATYFLVTHDDTQEAHDGGKVYMAYHLGTSILFLLPAIGLTWYLAGSLSFVPNGMFGSVDIQAQRGLLIVAFILFMAGNAKVALMPLHGWLPSAMVAPVPVSALLHAVAVVNAGAYGVIRIMTDVFGPEVLLALSLNHLAIWLAAFTVVAASLYALRLDNLKALLAFSTIGQLAYIVMGGALANAEGTMGGMIHIINHGFSKITLFLCAGAIYVATHKKYLSEMHGLIHEMPLTVLAFSVGAFSMIGLPLTPGFITKYYLFAGAQDAGNIVAIVALIASSLLTAIYYLRALATFLGWGNKGIRSSHRPSPPMGKEVNSLILWPMLACAIATLILGIFPEQTTLPLLTPVIGTLFGG